MVLDKPIKTLGLHPVRVALHPEVVVTVTANVAKSEDEAVMQEKAGGFIAKTEEDDTPDLDKLLAEAAEATGETASEEA